MLDWIAVIPQILLFAVILSLLVFIHELGHFLTAKKFGIKVEEFGFGFPPRIWGKKVGETIYSINLLPIGGFVKLFGEDEAGGGSLKKTKTESGDLRRAFFARPAWQRAIVVVAGVVMNFVLAAVIFYAFLGLSSFKTELPKIAEQDFYFANTQVKSDIIIDEVAEGSPAEAADIKTPSIVVGVNGEKVGSVDDFIAAVEKNTGEEMQISLKDFSTQEEYAVSLTPRENPPENEGALGVALFSFDTYVVSYDTPVQKIASGITYPINLMSYNINVIGKLIGRSVEEGSAEAVGQGVSGPIGIARIFTEIASIPDLNQKVLQILNFTGIISISLAFFNILPIPALDGGRLFFILIELVTKKKINPKYEAVIHAAGFIILLGLLLVVSIFDVQKFDLLSGFLN